MSWNRLGSWWIDELASDPAYEEEITPQLLGLLKPAPGRTYLDLGCGNGRMMKQVTSAGGRVVGCDLNLSLLRQAEGSRVQAVLPSLSWAKKRVFDGAYLGLVLEHLADESELFRSVAEVVRPAGVLALVINHPIWTAPGSSPIEQEDGEVLWRPGRYFGRGYSEELAGRQRVRFYHRTLSALLTAASAAGWDLQHVMESGISAAAVARTPDYAGQEEIPRILGLRWLRRSG
jgi:SAM-dependent methyltransferase